ncbi:HD domain-containing protein [Candidatus Uhrbacteria bacterium]|nr:HD domain-containing protein [Candidatus Uhrbacteria bacterium]
MEDLLIRAKALVKERIPGTRKGSDEPAYIHSTRVSDALARFGFSEEVVIAGMLHDIVEDGDTSLDDLRGMGFSERIVNLVDLCTHDDMIEGGDARWVNMMAGLIDAKDKEAWSIKLADLTDNVKSSDTMPEDRRKFMLEAKAPFLLRLSWNEAGDTPVWNELERVLLSLRGAEATKQS